MLIDALRAARADARGDIESEDAAIRFTVAHTLIKECENAPKNAATILAARIGSCAILASRSAVGYDLHLSQWGEATVTENYGEADRAASRAIDFLIYGRGGD